VEEVCNTVALNAAPREGRTANHGTLSRTIFFVLSLSTYFDVKITLHNTVDDEARQIQIKIYND